MNYVNKTIDKNKRQLFREYPDTSIDIVKEHYNITNTRILNALLIQVYTMGYINGHKSGVNQLTASVLMDLDKND